MMQNLILPDHVVHRLSIWIWIYFTYKYLWFKWFRGGRQSSKQEVVGSSLTVGKNFSFSYSRFLCVPHSLTKRFQMKSCVTYTKPIPCLSQGIVCCIYCFTLALTNNIYFSYFHLLSFEISYTRKTRSKSSAGVQVGSLFYVCVIINEGRSDLLILYPEWWIGNATNGVTKEARCKQQWEEAETIALN